MFPSGGQSRTNCPFRPVYLRSCASRLHFPGFRTPLLHPLSQWSDTFDIHLLQGTERHGCYRRARAQGSGPEGGRAPIRRRKTEAGKKKGIANCTCRLNAIWRLALVRTKYVPVRVSVNNFTPAHVGNGDSDGSARQFEWAPSSQRPFPDYSTSRFTRFFFRTLTPHLRPTPSVWRESWSSLHPLYLLL